MASGALCLNMKSHLELEEDNFAHLNTLETLKSEIGQQK